MLLLTLNTTPRVYSLVATTGAYTITGNNQRLDFQRKVTATTGTYTITGNNQQLNTQRKLIATTGTYSISGIEQQLKCPVQIH